MTIVKVEIHDDGRLVREIDPDEVMLEALCAYRDGLVVYPIWNAEQTAKMAIINVLIDDVASRFPK